VIAKTYLTTSEDETIEAGRDFAAAITRPSLVLLVGDLGAGKTTFTKGVVGALTGLPPEEITSPTFTLVHDYGAAVFHMDLYRLEKPAEVAALGVEDLLYDQDGILLVEWGERFPQALPRASFTVALSGGGDNRTIVVRASDLA
jgi:tRNA threonylcarbamoyladenosine biosynthesis protein TsaE